MNKSIKIWIYIIITSIIVLICQLVYLHYLALYVGIWLSFIIGIMSNKLAHYINFKEIEKTFLHEIKNEE